VLLFGSSCIVVINKQFLVYCCLAFLTLLLVPFATIWFLQAQVPFGPNSHVCCLALLLVACQFDYFPHLLSSCKFQNEELDPPSNCFLGMTSNYACNFVLFFWMLMFIFPFTLVNHFLMFQVQSLFVIKLGNILALGDMFVVRRIHIYFVLHCISFCTFIFYMERGELNKLFDLCKLLINLLNCIVQDLNSEINLQIKNKNKFWLKPFFLVFPLLLSNNFEKWSSQVKMRT
jgi:hypothetical protein